MCRLKKHAYVELSPRENHASQAKSLRPDTRNSAFPRALIEMVLSLNRLIEMVL